MRSLHKALFGATLIVSLFLAPVLVGANTLFVSPASGNYSVGQTFSVRVLVSSPSRSVNAISGAISFPRDQVQITSVSKAGSIITLWVVEPTFSNSVGTVSFEGVIPNPGYIGSNGTLLTINFRVIAPGSANVRVSSGSILANDGLGTNVLSTLGTSAFELTASENVPVEAVQPSVIEDAEIVEVPVSYTESAPVKGVIKDSWYDRLVEFFSTTPGLLFGFSLTLMLFLGVLLYGRGRFVHLRSNIRRETHDVEKVLHHSFDILKEDISACVGLLERARARRRLTEEERAVISLLKQHIRETEKLVSREIHDIRQRTEE